MSYTGSIKIVDQAGIERPAWVQNGILQIALDGPFQAISGVAEDEPPEPVKPRSTHRYIDELAEGYAAGRVAGFAVIEKREDEYIWAGVSDLSEKDLGRGLLLIGAIVSDEEVLEDLLQKRRDSRHKRDQPSNPD